MAQLAPEFLSMLCCPQSGARLVEVDGWLVSTCPDTRLRYPIRDGIPALVLDEAETLDAETWKEAQAAGHSNG